MRLIADLTGYELCYLATPYSKFPGGLEAAAIAACKLAGRLMQADVRVYSPIAHSHFIAKCAKIDPIDHDFWLHQDDAFLDMADALLIAEFPGWQESRGINYEFDVMRGQKKDIYYINPETLAIRM